MLRLVHILFGIQPKSTRQMPQIPAHWQDVRFSTVVIDSRLVVADALFVALPGERTDGHNFLSEAMEHGARGALVLARDLAQRREQFAEVGRPWVTVDPADASNLAACAPDTFLLILVDDTQMALQRMAVYHRRQLTPTVVGITGSVGKTSVKEVAAAVLSRRYRTLKSERSFNSEATLPTTLMQLQPDHEVAVLEMGMWAPGEIRFLANLARPKIGIVTNVGPSHLERLGSMEAIANAKAELVESLPGDGVAILNYDDERVVAMADRTAARVVSYGLDPRADVWADEIRSRGLEGISFRVHHDAESYSINAPLLGRHSVHIALAAIAAGLVMELGWEDIVAGLQDQSVQLRLFVVPGVGGSTIIDDTYNAAPASTLAALNLLADLAGRRIALMGDMLELGAVEEEAHRKVGVRAAEVADVLICMGTRARWIAEAALASGLPAGQVQMFAEHAQAVQFLQTLLQPGDFLLVKGSRGMAMEDIVAALQRRPEEEEK